MHSNSWLCLQGTTSATAGRLAGHSQSDGELSQHHQLGAIPPPPFLSLSLLECIRSGGTCTIPHGNEANRGRINREVQTVNWEAGKKGAVETGVKRGLKKAHKPWIRGKKAHKPWIREGLNREVQTVNLALSASKIPVFQFTVCTSWFARPWTKWVRYPHCDTISTRYCVIWGGISHWAAKVLPLFEKPLH